MQIGTINIQGSKIPIANQRPKLKNFAEHFWSWMQETPLVMFLLRLS